MTEELIITNTVLGESVTLNKDVSIYLLDEADWGSVASNHQTYKYINQVGVHITGSTLEPRDINIVGWVTGRGEREIEYKCRKLNRMINPLHPHTVVTGEYKLNFKPKSSVKYSPTYERNNDVMRRFLITGYCADPLFSNIKDTRIDAATTLPKFKFILRIPDKDYPEHDVRGGIIMGLREPSLLVDIENQGDVPSGMRIEFKATGTLTNPRLTNAVTGQYIQINKEMTAGERVVVITQDGSKRVTGIKNGIESNYYKYRDLNSNWLQLDVGSNLFQYGADNVDALEVIIYFSPKYLEVE